MSNENYAPEKVDLAPTPINPELAPDNLITSYEKDPSQPEGPLVNAEAASLIGSKMLEGAGDAVKTASLAREAEQAEQLAKPLQEGAITEVPKSLTTTPETTPTVPPTTTTVPRTTTTTTTTTPPMTTIMPKGTEPGTSLPGEMNY